MSRLEEIINDLPYSIRHSGEIEELKEFAREQAERVEELEEDYEYLSHYYGLETEQNKRYREALEFYADKDVYGHKSLDFPGAYWDEGKKARQSLAGDKS